MILQKIHFWWNLGYFAHHCSLTFEKSHKICGHIKYFLSKTKQNVSYIVLLKINDIDPYHKQWWWVECGIQTLGHHYNCAPGAKVISGRPCAIVILEPEGGQNHLPDLPVQWEKFTICYLLFIEKR